MIVSGGVNIYPQEAENLLCTHPAVADVAVIGVPDAEFGEAVKAVVQLREPSDAGPALAQALIDYCRARLSPIKCPKAWTSRGHAAHRDRQAAQAAGQAALLAGRGGHRPMTSKEHA